MSRAIPALLIFGVIALVAAFFFPAAVGTEWIAWFGTPTGELFLVIVVVLVAIALLGADW